MLSVDLTSEVVVEKKIDFNGNSYSLNSQKRYYIRRAKMENGVSIISSLHIDIYEHFSGKKVEKGYEVHHKDGNHFNNNYENLECLTISEHRKIHAKDRKPPTDFHGQDKAREWHGSKKGIEWHREHGRMVMENRELVSVSCKECGAGYKTKRPEVAEFCTTRCRQRFYRSNGIGMVDKICNCCNSSFKTQKRSKKEAVSCSRRCSVRFAIENKALIVNNKTGRFEKSRNQEDEN